MSFEIIDPGAGYNVGDTITFTGAGHAQVLVLTVDTVGSSQPSIQIAGSGYVDGTEHDIEFPGAIPIGGIKARGTISVTAGSITSIEIGAANKGRGYQLGDLCLINAGDINGYVLINSLENVLGTVHNLSATLTRTAVLNNPLLAEKNADLKFDNLALRDILDMKRLYNGTNGLEAEGQGPVTSNSISSKIAHIQVDDFNLESREAEDGIVGGVSGKTIAAVCIGSRAPNSEVNEGFFFDEPFNLIYHELNNPEQIVNNQINLRITDEMNIPFVGLQHPVVITLDLKSKK
tara:strand:+ start:1 stop:870 length:870 start_codon:yes stop_codon:yes gene_type:complete